MKKVLPIITPPFITYQGIAFNSIVILENENLKNYMYNHFIQWFCPKNYIDEEGFYINLQCSSYFTNKYIHERICVKKDIFKIDYKEIVKQFIDEGRYIAVDGFDMFYLENAQGYKENHFSHDAMIYGYDDEKEIYYMISYNKDRFFAPYTSSYKSLGESLNSTFISDEGVAFGMIRNTDEIVPIETEMIKETISQYLDGNNYLTKYDDKDIYMGVTVYKHTFFWLKNKKSNNNIKFLRIIMEHKVFMLERLRQINADKLLIEQYKKVSDTSVIMWNIALKYLITRQEKLIDDIINKLLYIRSEEGRVLREVIGGE